MKGVCQWYAKGECGAEFFGSWGENVGSWIGAKTGSKEFLLLRYEDMLIDTAKELGKVAKFLAIEASIAELNQAVEMSSFETMRELESKQSDTWIDTKATRSDEFFVRAGKAGCWRTQLPEKAVERIVGQWGGLMDRLGLLVW